MAKALVSSLDEREGNGLRGDLTIALFPDNCRVEGPQSVCTDVRNEKDPPFQVGLSSIDGGPPPLTWRSRLDPRLSTLDIVYRQWICKGKNNW